MQRGQSGKFGHLAHLGEKILITTKESLLNGHYNEKDVNPMLLQYMMLPGSMVLQVSRYGSVCIYILLCICICLCVT